MEFDAFYKITYGLYVVSSANGNKESGFISNTVMQVTAEPVQLAVCSSKDNYTTELILQSKHLAISALAIDTPRELIGLFGYKSGRENDKFASYKHFRGNNNVPVLTESTLAWFQCHVVSEQDLGTHYLFIVIVDNCSLTDIKNEPMTYGYYRDVLKGKSPKSAPTYIKPKQKMEVNMKNNEIWVCEVCGYEYDPAVGDPDSNIPAGTAFEDLPEDWVCPLCGVGKGDFVKK